MAASVFFHSLAAGFCYKSRRGAMRIVRFAMAAVMMLALALPVWADGYKNTYPDPCSVVWSAVKDTLGQQAYYDTKNVDDAQMNADFQMKYQTKVQVQGVNIQRVNHVTLAPKGSGCELQVTPTYYGWSRYDVNDFKKRLEASLAKRRNGTAK